MKLNKNSIICIIVIILAVITLLVLVLLNPFDKVTSNKKGSKSTYNLRVNLTQIGSKYYSDIFYKSVNGNTNFLENYKEQGLTITLSDLNVVINFDKELAQALVDKNCDTNKSTLFFYPKKPYKSNDVEVKVNLVCDK